MPLLRIRGDSRERRGTDAAPAGAGSRPGADAALDLAVWAFGLWTVLCQLVTASGGGLATLIALSPLLLLVLAASWRLVVRPIETREGHADSSSHSARPLPPPFVATGAGALAAATGAAALLAGWGSGLWTPAWGLAAASLGCALAAGGRPAPPGRAVAGSCVPWMILALVVTIGVSRPDADDGMYHAVALAASADPEAPLFCCDVLHGRPDLPLEPASYRLRSLELIPAAVHLLTGAPPWILLHLVLPPLGALGLCLAHRRLLRLLVPRAWPPVFAVTVLIFLTLDAGHAWHGNFGLVRLHQGKGLLVSVLLPLLAGYGLEAGFARGPGRWLRLAGGVFAAIGLNPSAILVAPVVAGLAFLAAAPRARPGRLAILVGVLAAPAPFAWPLLGILPRRLRDDLGATSADVLIESAVGYVAGPPSFALVLATVGLLAPWAVAPGIARRWTALGGLALLAGPLDPWAVRWLAATFFGPTTLWRLFWLVPAPLLVALTLVGPGRTRGPARLRRLAAAALAVALAAAADGWILAPSNGLGWAPLVPRVPAAKLRAGDALARAVPPGALVLAPRDLAPWMFLQPDPPIQWATRARYLRRHFGLVEERRDLLDAVSRPGRARVLEQLLPPRLPALAGVAFGPGVDPGPAVESALRAARFRELPPVAGYRLFVADRRPSAPPEWRSASSSS